MGDVNHKYEQAKLTASKDPAIIAARRRWQVMTRETLYELLDERGYSWSVERQCWYPRQEVVVKVPAKLEAFARDVYNTNEVFLLRIMAPRSEMGKIEADFFELAEALNWSIERDSREYPNEGDGNWVRKYFTVKRG